MSRWLGGDKDSDERFQETLMVRCEIRMTSKKTNAVCVRITLNIIRVI